LAFAIKASSGLLISVLTFFSRDLFEKAFFRFRKVHNGSFLRKSFLECPNLEEEFL